MEHLSSGIESLLNKQGIPFTVKGKDLVVKCLNPEHEDNNPSCRIDRTTGAFHCFSCSFKGNIFKHFGIVTNTVSIKVARLKEKIKAVTESVTEVQLPGLVSPFNNPIKGISVVTLRKFGAVKTTDEEMADRVCFPLTDISGKITHYIGRHIESNANPRYKVYPSGKPLPLFPNVFESRFKSVVFVEGIFDMLKLQEYGIHNTVSVFGTTSISEKSAVNKLLPLKVQGIRKIFILFDGDAAGIKAAKDLKPLLELNGFDVEIINLPENVDPNEMDDEDIEGLKQYIQEYENSSN